MRTIGIRHRRKQTREGEARPTMMSVKDNGHLHTFELSDDTAELDFVRGLYPVAWRPIEPEETLDGYRHWHCKWRLVPRDVDMTMLLGHHLRQRADGRWQIVTHVPTTFDGLRVDDKVAMVMGGSGDRFAAALSRRGDEIGAKVYRIPPFAFKTMRGGDGKEADQEILIDVLARNPDLFYLMRLRDREVVRVREALMLRQDAMKARIACSQRLEQRLVGAIFLSEQGGYPEGRIEDAADERRANDRILGAMEQAEAEQDTELAAAVKATDVWREVFSTIEGCGVRIAAGLIAAIGTIQRFQVTPDLAAGLIEEEHLRRKRKAANQGAAKLKAFCGVHVLAGGQHQDVPAEKSFPRRRAGSVSNWSPLARQSLYLLADQFNRRPGSHWGKKLLLYKEVFRQKHPVEVEVRVNGSVKKRYTKGHIHRMAIWRTLTKFVEWLFRQWIALENRQREVVA